MPNRVAIYAGSFDPPTFGHLDLIERATTIFGRLIVAVAQNDAKTCLFSVEERIDMLSALCADMPTVELTAFRGLTADFARERKATALVRGLRVASDFEFELTMAITNQKLNAEVDTVCLMPSEPYLFLSSKLVREIARFGGALHEFVPPQVEAALQRKFQVNSKIT